MALYEAYIEEKFQPVEDAWKQKINKARRRNGSVLLQWIDAMGFAALSEVEQQDMLYYVSILERMPKNYG